MNKSSKGVGGPKDALNRIASGENDPRVSGSNADETLYITGDQDPEDTLLAQARRRQKFQDGQDALYRADADAKDKAANGGKGDAAFNANGADVDDEGGYTVRGLWRYKIRDYGDYLTVRGKDKLDPRTNQRKINDDQLRMLIMTAVLVKGFNKEIGFFRGGRIDQELTQRAVAMLATDRGLIDHLDGKIPAVQRSLKPEPPSFITSGIGKFFHTRRYNAQVKRSWLGDEKDKWDVNTRMAANFEREDGQLLKEIVNDKALGETGHAYAQSPLHRVTPHINPLFTPPSA